jgi:hypothetical protein
MLAHQFLVMVSMTETRYIFFVTTPDISHFFDKKRVGEKYGVVEINKS